MEQLQVLVTLKRRNRFLNLSVPVYALYIAVLGVVALTAAGGLLGRFFLSRLTGQTSLRELVQENAVLRGRLQAYSAALDSVSRFITIAEEMDNKLRASTNLYLIPSDMRLMGIGGTSQPENEPRVDNLLRRVKLEQQSLGEIEAAVNAQETKLKNLPSVWPLRGWVASGCGGRRDPFTNSWVQHEGLDVVAPSGTPIVAPADGRVVYSGWRGGWGRCVEIDHGYGIRTFYGHCRTLNVSVGDRVTRGRQLATVGSSGRSTGVHLHYAVTLNGNWVNPNNYILTQLAAD